MNAATLKLQAGATGQSIPQAVKAHAVTLLAGRSPDQLANEKWRRLPENVRMILVTLCTTRDNITAAAEGPWMAFSQDERIRIGACARELLRGLEGAAPWLR